MTCAFEVTERRMQVRGLTLNVAEAGAGSLVVLLHGFPDSWRLRRHQMEALAQAGHRVIPPDLRVIPPDLRGFGDSDKPAAVDQYALPMRAENPVTALTSRVCHPAAWWRPESGVNRRTLVPLHG